MNSTKNPIILGYGDDDESEEYYKILDSNDDSALEFFKTNNYMRSKSYKRLEEMLGATQSIELTLIGLSCSNSDKALLNYIFKKENV